MEKHVTITILRLLSEDVKTATILDFLVPHQKFFRIPQKNQKNQKWLKEYSRLVLTDLKLESYLEQNVHVVPQQGFSDTHQPSICY